MNPVQGVGGLVAAGLATVVVGLRGPILGVLGATLLAPFQLGPAVAAGWTLTRDVAMGLLLVALLYGVLRSQLAPLVGLDATQPWHLLPRLALAVVGVATSLPLVRGLLSANNALCATLVHAAPPGSGGLAPMAGGVLVLSVLPEALNPALAVGALLALLGAAALACFYIVRAAEIVLLTLLLPIAAALWVVPAAAGVWRALMAELLVSIFVQSVQVVVLLVFATGMGLQRATGGTSWLWSIAALLLLFRCRRLLAAAVRALAQLGPEPGQLLAAATPVLGVAARQAQRFRASVARVRETGGM
ncbi:MAG TPA: conjugal transfer protein TrbL family protein [Bacillota bacterium]|nr:conjugal transfer protein TrbL family protein [Bacillota bacterium]